VGVAGYGLYRGGTRVDTSSSTSGIFSGLTCNTSYTLAVDAYDAAGNRSAQTVVMVSTTACPDTSAPSSPTGLAASNVTQTGLTVTWNASTDNVGVTGYDVYRGGTKVATVTSTSSAQSGLVCGTSYSFGVVARDAAGNSSSQASSQASTSACSTSPPPSTYFAGSSPWNTPIGQAVVAAQSSQWINTLYNNIGEIDVNQSAWTPGIFYADASTPRKTVPLDEGWTLDDVPIPSNLTPSNDADAYAIIIDTARGRAYEFFSLRPSSTSPSGWWARTADVLRLSGSGFWNGNLGPWGSLSSGMGFLGGLIRKSEIDAGVINHALLCGAPANVIENRSYIGIPPATTSDGTGPAGYMPMGSRLQIDPSLSMSQLPVEPGDAILVRALQQYGCYVGISTGPSMILFGENYLHLPGGVNPYPSSLANGISKELLRYMRVVEGPPAPVYDDRTVFGQPHR
jgi:chitodextrinase